ncbi:MAG: transposase [Candidatus Aminicenantales bacterium]
MPRAKRYYIPGYAWHITHRCHKKEFLLKFNHDRKRWLSWLYQAKERFHISILNYMVTSNHIHLLAQCERKSNDIAKAIHLASGRTAWEFNRRKKRRGAFWEDRYHATAVETDLHLVMCMVYIDTNMVRAGVVEHPCQWPYCGYQEISGSRKRYTLIDHHKLIEIMGGDGQNFKEIYDELLEEYLRAKNIKRESRWTESVAVGSKDFVEKIHKKLGIKVKGRKIINNEDSFELRETRNSYSRFLAPKMKFKA